MDLNTSKTDLLGKVNYDALTGIYNRRFMEETLNCLMKSLSRSDGASHKLSVLMIDIDFFKKYNDTYSHSMGDQCLTAVAHTLENVISRGDDFVARYGGEEFIVVLPNTDKEGACLIAEKLLEAVSILNIPHEKNTASSCVTISIGVTTGTVKYTQTEGDYIKCADKALYSSKKNGRNRYTYISFEEDDAL